MHKCYVYRRGGPHEEHGWQAICRKEVRPELSLKVLGNVKEVSTDTK